MIEDVTNSPEDWEDFWYSPGEIWFLGVLQLRK